MGVGLTTCANVCVCERERVHVCANACAEEDSKGNRPRWGKRRNLKDDLDRNEACVCCSNTSGAQEGMRPQVQLAEGDDDGAQR